MVVYEKTCQNPLTLSQMTVFFDVSSGCLFIESMSTILVRSKKIRMGGDAWDTGGTKFSLICNVLCLLFLMIASSKREMGLTAMQ